MRPWLPRSVRWILNSRGASPPFQHRRSDSDYELLPTSASASSNGSTQNGYVSTRRRSWRTRCWHAITLRRILISFASVLGLLVFSILVQGIPPGYRDIYEHERRLPQHDLDLPIPEGQHGRYLRFPGQIWGHGLNNVLQEIVLSSHLAYLSNRSYVFEDYTWSHSPLPYTLYDFALRPSRMPLNAFISGPSAGGPMPAPRSISAQWWDTVCPPERRVVLKSDDAPAFEEGDEILAWWVAKLGETPANCVEVDPKGPPVFNPFLFGSGRVLSTWRTLQHSPVITSFSWSPLVQEGVDANLHLLFPSAIHEPTPPREANQTISGLVALHLRRGDYIRHCPRLADWGATFMGFNQFPELPDRFSPPDFNSFGGRKQYYLDRCWPDLDAIASKLREVRAAYPSARRVYVLTNGWGWWVSSLRQKLQKDGWEQLTSSLDVRLNSEQTWVSMAVDMEIAQRAEVFVGNGFSSLTSNIVMLRMAAGIDPHTNRFW